MIFYTSTPDYYNDYIAHFGILGMKWGKKNGPPYPLGSSISTGRRLKNVGSVKKKKRDRHERAADAAAKDAADLRAHGYTEEADAVQKVADQQRAKSKTAKLPSGVKTINQGPKYATPSSRTAPNPELAKRAKEIGDKEVYEVAKGKPIKNIKSPETGFAQKEIDRKNPNSRLTKEESDFVRKSSNSNRNIEDWNKSSTYSKDFLEYISWQVGSPETVDDPELIDLLAMEYESGTGKPARKDKNFILSDEAAKEYGVKKNRK